jgi:Subtilase family
LRQIFAHRFKAIALLAVLGFLLTLPLIKPAKAATACPSGETISEAQRKSLQELPLGLRSVLQAVRAQKQTSCKAPDQQANSNAVDPLSIPANASLSAPLINVSAVPDEVVAIITGDGSNIAGLAAANGLSVRSSRRSDLLGGFIVRFGINDGRTPAAVTTILQQNDSVDTPGPNHLYQLQASTPKTSVYEEARFAPKNFGMPTGNFNLSGKNILIGVIDTAIDPDHPDLKGAVVEIFDALPGQPISNRRHGTAVAGLIAGRSMIRGIAPKAGLLIARAFDESKGKSNKASATSYQLLEALDWTISKGARIVNMSFTGPRNNLMSKALAAAARKNVLLIAAAGNNGPEAPAAYPAAEQSVLAVTATDIDNRIYAEANVGKYVFVAAPGVDVLAAAPDKGIDLVSGTSFAAPFLSGLAALMLEQNSDLTPRQFAKRLEQTSRDLGQPGRDDVFGVGLADLGKALEQQ